jgi:hypothetical protein
MVGPGKSKASKPKRTPKVPRSVNSHQFRASPSLAAADEVSKAEFIVVLAMAFSQIAIGFA